MAKDLERAFLAGERGNALRFVLNDAVRITDGPHSGRVGAVVALIAVEPEVLYLIEFGGTTFGDVEVPDRWLEMLP